MTKDQKQLAIAEAKIEAYDHIADLLLILDSHRNFYRQVLNTITTTAHVIAEIERTAATQSPQFRCMCADSLCKQHEGGPCHLEATSQLFRSDMQDESGTMMCDICAEDALASGVFTIQECDVQ